MICYTKVRINIEIPNKISIYIKKLIVVLSEGKKEEVSKRLKQKFEYDGPFIDRVLNIDPTGYKYAEYIGRYLESVIPAIAGDKDRKSTRLNSSHIQKSRMPSSA